MSKPARLLRSMLTLSTITSGGGVAAVNAYQRRERRLDAETQGLRQQKPHFQFRSSPMKEVVGVAFGLATHNKLAPNPYDDFARDPVRQALQKELSQRMKNGVMTEWEYHTIRQVSLELYHHNVPLHPKEKDAILNALDTMKEHETDFTENPTQWIAKKLETERLIANAFSEGGSTVGWTAHMAKGFLEAGICAALHPITGLVVDSKPSLVSDAGEKFKGLKTQLHDLTEPDNELDNDDDDTFSSSKIH